MMHVRRPIDRTNGAPWQTRLRGARWDRVRARVRATSLGRAGCFDIADVAYDRLETPEHRHGWDSLHLVLRGEVHEWYGGVPRQGLPGSLLVYRAGVPHLTRVSAGARIIHLPLPRRDLPGDRRAAPRALLIGSAEATSALRLFAGLVVRRAEDGRQVLESFERSSGPADDRAHAAASRLGAAHAPPSLQQLADAIGTSRGQCARLFRRAHGCSVGEMVRRIRVARALLRVVGDGTPLTTIAVQSGFADQSHMGRDFKRVLGVTPGRLRAGPPGARAPTGCPTRAPSRRRSR